MNIRMSFLLIAASVALLLGDKEWQESQETVLNTKKNVRLGIKRDMKEKRSNIL